jgi:hypothetical protein
MVDHDNESLIYIPLTRRIYEEQRLKSQCFGEAAAAKQATRPNLVAYRDKATLMRGRAV